MLVKKTFMALLSAACMLCFLCSGCAEGAQAHRGSSESEAAAGTESSPPHLLNSDDNYNGPFEIEPDFAKNTVRIYDLASGSEAGTIECGEGEILQNAWKYDNGFAALKSKSRAEMDEEQIGEGITVVVGNDSSNGMEAYTLVYYDYDLNPVKSVSLLEYIRQDEVEVWGAPFLSRDGEKAAWVLQDSSVYCIDLSEQKSYLLHAAAAEGIYPSMMVFAGEDKIGFFGSMIDVAGTAYYGYIDMKEDKIYYESEKGYETEYMYVYGSYLCLNDFVDPDTMKSSGKVLLYNCETNESRVVEVDGRESTLSAVSKDGKLLISVNWFDEKQFRIRNYDLESMEVIYETVCEMDGNVRPYSIEEYGDDYIVLYRSAEWGALYATGRS